jgi:hypothetical protein
VVGRGRSMVAVVGIRGRSHLLDFLNARLQPYIGQRAHNTARFKPCNISRAWVGSRFGLRYDRTMRLHGLISDVDHQDITANGCVVTPAASRFCLNSDTVSPFVSVAYTSKLHFKEEVIVGDVAYGLPRIAYVTGDGWISRLVCLKTYLERRRSLTL